MRKVIVYIACSVDGYIAKPNDDLSFLDSVQQEGEDYGYMGFMEQVDTVIMGRKTYDWVMSKVPVFPHQDKQSYIITRSPRAAIHNTQFYSEDLGALVLKLKTNVGKNIFIDGGAQIVNALLKEKLVDEFHISLIPILLGEGVRLFDSGIFLEQPLTLISNQSFPKGLVQLRYAVGGGGA